MTKLQNKKQRQKAYIRMLDNLMMIASVIHPLSALPQVYMIYATQNVEGISLSTWLGFMFLGFVFLAYGIVHKIRPFIVTQVIWFTVDLLIVVGILLYR